MFLVVLLFPSLALGETVNAEDLFLKDGIHYKKFTSVPFTGKVQRSFEGGNLHTSFKNGKLDGPWVFYWKNGQLREKGTFKEL